MPLGEGPHLIPEIEEIWPFPTWGPSSCQAQGSKIQRSDSGGGSCTSYNYLKVGIKRLVLETPYFVELYVSGFLTVIPGILIEIWHAFFEVKMCQIRLQGPGKAGTEHLTTFFSETIFSSTNDKNSCPFTKRHFFCIPGCYRSGNFPFLPWAGL